MKDTDRITNLEDRYMCCMWYTTVFAGTTGTIAPPEGGTLVMSQWPGGVSAKASTITAGEVPTGTAPQTSLGVDITVTMSSTGAWALSGTPSAYPIAILYCYRTKLFRYNPAYNIDTGIGWGLHSRQHAITSASDHTSTATAGKMLKADANGLPVDATNTDTEVSAAVTASHPAVTIGGTSPLSIVAATQVLNLKNNAVSPAAVTAIDIDGALAGNSDTVLATQKAVKTYADTKTTLAAVKADADISSAISLKHAAVTLAAGATSNILSLSTQELSVKTQSANLVLAGPASGAAAAPTFRALAADDLPSLSGLYLPLTGGTMTGNIVMPDGGTIGQAAGPLLAFDDTNNYLEITGCNVGIGTTTPAYTLQISGRLRSAATIADTSGWGQSFATTHNVTTGTLSLYGTQYNTTLNISGGTGHSLYGFLQLTNFNLSNAATIAGAHSGYFRSDMYGDSPTGTITSLNELTLGGFFNATTGTPAVAITTRRGLYITHQAYIGTGFTITTSVALDIANQSGATYTYAIRTGTGIVQFGDYVTTVGGLHVGGTSDPGTDNLLVDGTGTITGAFGCNSKTAQTAYASGGALAAYGTGSYGLDSAANMSALHALVVKIRAALVANGIMS